MYVLKFNGNLYIGENPPPEGRSYPVPRKTLNDAKLFETREEAAEYLTYLYRTFDKHRIRLQFCLDKEMTIKELIESLAKLPQEAEVLFYNKQDDASYSLSFIDDTYANDGYYSRVYLEESE